MWGAGDERHGGALIWPDETTAEAPAPEESLSTLAADTTAILQVKVWLTGISPMVWRRVLVPASFTLRELHGVIQVTMGWEGIHLYDFQLRAARYGSWEAAAASPYVTLAALRFRKGARFIYEYDLNIPWRHEVRNEDRLPPEVRKTYPVCTGGGGTCPPEDGGGPESFMARRDDRFSFDALEDLDTMADVLPVFPEYGRLIPPERKTPPLVGRSHAGDNYRPSDSRSSTASRRGAIAASGSPASPSARSAARRTSSEVPFLRAASACAIRPIASAWFFLYSGSS